MKNTVTLSASRRIVINPVNSSSVLLEIQQRSSLTNEWENCLPLVLDQGCAGLLVGGIEHAFDEIDRRERIKEKAAALWL